MYRVAEPKFCRACGVAWIPGEGECRSCGEPRDPPAIDNPRPEYRSQAQRVGLLGVLLVANAVMLCMAAADGVLDNALLERVVAGEVVPDAAWDASDDRYALILWTALAVYIATTVVFCRWLFVAGRNLRANGVHGLRYSEDGRVAWFFVPLLNLVKPFWGVRELWRASHPGSVATAWKSRPVPVVITAWWLLFIGSHVMGLVAYGLPEEFAEDLILANNVGLAGLAARLLATPLLWSIVIGIHRNQERAARALRERPGL